MSTSTLMAAAGRLADQYVSRHQPLNHEWEHEPGIFLRGLADLYGYTEKPAYLKFLVDSLSPLIAEDGTIAGYDPLTYELDNIVPGRALFALYDATGDEKYRLAADALARQLDTHPITSFGSLLHKKIFPEILFIDSIYMGMPFLAEYEARFGRQRFDRVADNILTAFSLNFRADKGLMLHGYDAKKSEIWANPETGNSGTFWGRGMGWYTLGIVEVLDHLPADFPRRSDILQVLSQLLEGVVRWQADNGVWYQVIDQPGREGNYYEASASAMFTAALAKSVQKGYVPRSFEAAALKAGKGLVDVFVRTDKDGTLTLTGTCASGGLGVKDYRNGSFESYACEPTRDNDLKGLGVLMMAAVAVERLQSPAGEAGGRR